MPESSAVAAESQSMSSSQPVHPIDQMQAHLESLLPERTRARLRPGADMVPIRRLVPLDMLPWWLNKAVGLENRLNMKLRPLVARLKARLLRGAGLDLVQVGNIAMYGLLNALVLQKARCRSDVVSFDFYHFAATPEFHFLADNPNVENVIGSDHYFTNFWKLDHTQRYRPRWFAQGPLSMCMAYMTVRKCGPKDLEDVAWAALEYSRLKALTEKTYTPQSIYWSAERLEQEMAQLSLSPEEIANFRLGHALDGFLAAWRDVALRFADEASVNMVTPPFAQGFLDMYAQHDARFARLVRDFRRSGLMFASGFEVWPSLRGPSPTQPDDMNDEDWAAHSHWARHWRNLFEQYDAAILHAAYPVIGRATGHQPYFGYEIGTIRSIPFEDTPLGRQTYVGYQHARATFVTNSDYPLLTRKIEGLDEKAVFTPHAFDEEKVLRFAARYRATMKRPAVPTFLAPARQWWYNRPFTDSKRNDLTIKAARILKDKGYRDFRIEMVKWGPDLEQSQALMDELDVTDVVVWVPTMSRAELWGKTCEGAAVIDQFGIPGFGGVAFETLTLGTRLITLCYEDNDAKFFGSAPPVLRAGSEEEVAARIEQCILDPLDEARVGEAGVAWVKGWHSSDRAADIARAAFTRYI